MLVVSRAGQASRPIFPCSITALGAVHSFCLWAQCDFRLVVSLGVSPWRRFRLLFWASKFMKEMFCYSSAVHLREWRQSQRFHFKTFQTEIFIFQTPINFFFYKIDLQRMSLLTKFCGIGITVGTVATRSRVFDMSSQKSGETTKRRNRLCYGCGFFGLRFGIDFEVF